jgi:hypothetical protein
MSQLKLPSVSTQTFDLIFGYVYTGLAVNLSMVVANAPLAAAVALVREPAMAWPFFLLLSPTLAPSVAAAFAAFEALGRGEPSPFAAFWRGWVRSLKPALGVGVALGALVLLVGLDLATTAGTPAGALLAPVLVLAVALGVAMSLLVLSGLASRERPEDAPLGALVRASVYLALRRAPISLLSLAAVAGACVFVLAQPVLGALLGVAPLLFVAFGNSRATLAIAAAASAKE